MIRATLVRQSCCPSLFHRTVARSPEVFRKNHSQWGLAWQGGAHWRRTAHACRACNKTRRRPTMQCCGVAAATNPYPVQRDILEELGSSLDNTVCMATQALARRHDELGVGCLKQVCWAFCLAILASDKFLQAWITLYTGRRGERSCLRFSEALGLPGKTASLFEGSASYLRSEASEPSAQRPTASERRLKRKVAANNAAPEGLPNKRDKGGESGRRDVKRGATDVEWVSDAVSGGLRAKETFGGGGKPPDKDGDSSGEEDSFDEFAESSSTEERRDDLSKETPVKGAQTTKEREGWWQKAIRGGLREADVITDGLVLSEEALKERAAKERWEGAEDEAEIEGRVREAEAKVAALKARQERCAVLDPGVLEARLHPGWNTVEVTRRGTQRSQSREEGAKVAPRKQGVFEAELDHELKNLLRAKRLDDAIRTLQNARASGKVASRRSYSWLVTLLCRQRRFATAHNWYLSLEKDVGLRLDDTALAMLVQEAVRIGRKEEAWALLQVMHTYGYCPRVATWSAVVSLFSRQPETAERALHIWREVRGWRFGSQEVHTDTGAYNAALNACISLQDLTRAEALWQQLQDEGLEPDVLTYNIMLRGYALIGEEQRMQAGVESMTRKGVKADVSTYNTRVAGHVQLGDVAAAERLLDEVRGLAGLSRKGSSLRDDESAVSKVLASSGVALETRQDELKAGEQAEGYVWTRSRVANERADPETEQRVGSEQVGSSRSLGNGQSSFQTIEIAPLSKGEATEKNGAFTEGKTNDLAALRPEEPGPTFAEFRSEAAVGFREPTGRSDGYGRIQPTVRTYTALLRGYVKEGRLKEAFDLVEEMVASANGRADALPNVITYTTLIDGCIRNGKLGVARKVVEWMRRQGVQPNVVTYNTLLRGAVQSKELGVGTELWREMEAGGVDADVVTYNTMMDLCIKCDQVSEGFRWFKRLKDSHLAPTIVSYTTAMRGLGLAQETAYAERLFRTMLDDKNVQLDLPAWNVVIDTFCRVGEMALAKRVFEAMKSSGIRPDLATYGSLVLGFSRQENIGEVLVLWKEIRARNANARNIDAPSVRKRSKEVGTNPRGEIVLDQRLCDEVLSACIRAGYYERALSVIAVMEELGMPIARRKYGELFQEEQERPWPRGRTQIIERSPAQNSFVEKFKAWLGLDNSYYQRDWNWRD